MTRMNSEGFDFVRIFLQFSYKKLMMKAVKSTAKVEVDGVNRKPLLHIGDDR